MPLIGRHSFVAALLSLAVSMTPLLSQATVVPSAPALLQEAVGLNGVVMFMSSGAPGMVLVVVRGPDTVIQGYGETSKGNGIQPEALGRARQ